MVVHKCLLQFKANSMTIWTTQRPPHHLTPSRKYLQSQCPYEQPGVFHVLLTTVVFASFFLVSTSFALLTFLTTPVPSFWVLHCVLQPCHAPNESKAARKARHLMAATCRRHATHLRRDVEAYSSFLRQKHNQLFAFSILLRVLLQVSLQPLVVVQCFLNGNKTCNIICHHKLPVEVNSLVEGSNHTSFVWNGVALGCCRSRRKSA